MTALSVVVPRPVPFRRARRTTSTKGGTAPSLRDRYQHGAARIVVRPAETSVSTGTGGRPVQSGAESTAPAGLRPRGTRGCCSGSPASFLLRFAGRQFLGSLFQLPPRITRFEALAVHRERL